jgi:hypothetical protein
MLAHRDGETVDPVALMRSYYACRRATTRWQPVAPGDARRKAEVTTRGPISRSMSCRGTACRAAGGSPTPTKRASYEPPAGRPGRRRRRRHLAARLLGVEASALLESGSQGPLTPRDGTLLGQLFESLVTLDVRVYAQAAEARVGHLRTHGGEHEVDLIVERGDHRVVAIEVKLAHSVRDDDLQPPSVAAGPARRRRGRRQVVSDEPRQVPSRASINAGCRCIVRTPRGG